MFGFKFASFSPTTFVIHTVNGVVKRKGRGLSFFYFAPWSNLEALPVGSEDLPFVFNITTADFQAVTLQGQLTYRVSEPEKLAALLDYSVDEDGTLLTDDHDKLQQRLIHTTQVLTNALTGQLDLAGSLQSLGSLTTKIEKDLSTSEAVTMLGVEVLGLMLLSIKPTPEMARALEAEARESLQGKADDAIFERRQHALEQERSLKETELATRKAVEAKERELREAQLQGDISAEKQRAELVEENAKNEKINADARAYALDACLKPLEKLDVRKVTALTASSTDPRASIALAFQELAENAANIGELNVSPDLLRTLLDRRDD